MSVLLLGVLTFVAVVIGVVTALTMANRQAREEAAPASSPRDFVAPVSSGGFRRRAADESTDEFRARVAKENAEAQSPPAPSKPPS
jgi:hypothetical protein